MSRIGILAYGSLIDDPGKELVPFICERIADIKTPFSIEFARSSNSRDGAPTLIPVEDGGAQVKGVILVLDSEVGLQKAEDLLWRKETRNECSDKHLNRPAEPNANSVVIEHIENLANVDKVLFTKIGANIENRNPDYLADLAICSARREAGNKHMDGISYLMSIKKQRIRTPLMPDYEAAILRKTKAQTLDEAYYRIISGGV